LPFVRYLSKDSWTHLTIFRETGRKNFPEPELEIVSLALSAVVWMKPGIVKSISPAAFESLSNRRRTVMLLLLEGFSRKEIATRLQVTLHTVNDHIRAILIHFEVGSTTQLAARFLRSID
jgi:DNA-binding NarL/FixJ family response regulator